MINLYPLKITLTETDIWELPKPKIKMMKISPRTRNIPYMRKGILFLPNGETWDIDYGVRIHCIPRVFSQNPYMVVVLKSTKGYRWVRNLETKRNMISESPGGSKEIFFFGRTHKSGWGLLWGKSESLPLTSVISPALRGAMEAWSVYKTLNK